MSILNVALPFATSLTAWGNALSWSLYGLLIVNNPLIYGPNLMGFLLTSFQMSLFFVYGFHTPIGDGSSDSALKRGENSKGSDNDLTSLCCDESRDTPESQHTFAYGTKGAAMQGYGSKNLVTQAV